MKLVQDPLRLLQLNPAARSAVSADLPLPPPVCRYIVVTGGVVSGLGKGITISSLGVVLKASPDASLLWVLLCSLLQLLSKARLVLLCGRWPPTKECTVPR